MTYYQTDVHRRKVCNRVWQIASALPTTGKMILFTTKKIYNHSIYLIYKQKVSNYYVTALNSYRIRICLPVAQCCAREKNGSFMMVKCEVIEVGSALVKCLPMLADIMKKHENIAEAPKNMLKRPQTYLVQCTRCMRATRWIADCVPDASFKSHNNNHKYSNSTYKFVICR